MCIPSSQIFVAGDFAKLATIALGSLIRLCHVTDDVAIGEEKVSGTNGTSLSLNSFGEFGLGLMPGDAE